MPDSPRRPRPSFGWIHLSDIHFDVSRGRTDLERERIVASLITDATTLSETTATRVDAIMVTGDIAYTGGGRNAREYARATNFLVRLALSVNVDRANIFTVAGNHDINRRPNHDATGLLLKSLQTDDREIRIHLDDAISRTQPAKILAARMQPFTRFAGALGGVQIDRFGWWSHSLAAHNDRIGVALAGFNTAIISYRENEEKKLEVGLHQLGQLTGDVDADLRIALLHHPISWLRDDDDVVAELMKKFDIIMFGHVHRADFSVMSSIDTTGVVLMQAGAVHSHGYDEAVDFTYNICSVHRNDSAQLELRCWPRRWSQRRKVFTPDYDQLSGNDSSALLVIPRRRAMPTTTGRPPIAAHRDELDHLATAASRALESLGRRRTAYPLDLSFGELLSRQLFVTPRLELDGPTDSSVMLSEWLSQSLSILVLGEPGAGKSLLTYAVLRQIRAEGRLFCLPVDLSRYIAALRKDARSNPLDYMIDGDSVATSAAHAPLIRLVVDGVDEILSSGESPREVGQALEQLRHDYPCIVVSRRHEYENILAASIDAHLFDRIVRIAPWEVEREFAEFTTRLGDAHMLDAAAAMATVRADTAIAALTQRPLHARMLTYVLGEYPDITSLVDLYSAYLTKLSRSIDAEEPQTPSTARDLWCRSAHRLYRDRQFVGARTDYDVLLAAMKQSGVGDRHASRIIQGLYYVSEIGNRMVAEPLHYSFLEFCVAWAISDEILAAATEQSSIPDVFGTRELSREIRQYLTALLNQKNNTNLLTWLEGMYDMVTHRSADHPTVATIRGNLVIYLLGRITNGAPDSLRRIIATEDDAFLVNSAWWALVMTGSWQAAQDYLTTMESDEHLRALNRGHHLYYFGDVNEATEPPYLDHSNASWRNSRLRLLELAATGSRSEIPHPRLLIDTYTLLDFLRARNESLSPDEELVIGPAIARLLTLDRTGRLDVLRRIYGEQMLDG